MYGILLALHIFVAISLIIAVLLQAGKGGGLASAFGGSGAQAVFGGRGAATFLSKITTIFAVVFFLTSISLALLKKPRESASVLQGQLRIEQTQQQTPMPFQLPAEGEAGGDAAAPAAQPEN